MQITILSVGGQTPEFIQHGLDTYTKRFRYPFTVTHRHLSNNHHGQDKRKQDSHVLQQALTKGAYTILLDVTGQTWTSEQLTKQLTTLQHTHQQITLIIGGSDGADDQLKASVHARWSLSALTFPHQLVRLLLTEQLYRAYSLITNHPYHRS
jgi:23S rRNA (pseudouridine1915-N3)-methyltransferase